MCFLVHNLHPTWLRAECEEWEVQLYSLHIRSLLCDTQMQSEAGFRVPQSPRLIPLIQPAATSKDSIKYLSFVQIIRG